MLVYIWKAGWNDQLQHLWEVSPCTDTNKITYNLMGAQVMHKVNSHKFSRNDLHAHFCGTCATLVQQAVKCYLLYVTANITLVFWLARV